MTVPKLIHQYWTGGPLPDVYAGRSARLEAMNPGWAVHRWTDDTVGPLVNQDRFDRPDLYSHPDRVHVFRSNLVRAELLLEMGGVYVDYDWEAHRPFDDLDAADHHLGHNGANPDLTVVGCTPGHRLAAALVAELGRLPENYYRRNAGCLALRTVLEQLDLDVADYRTFYARPGHVTADTIGTTPLSTP